MFLVSLLLKIAAVSVFVFFYQEGGQGHKWMKRWLAPSLLAAFTILIAFIDHSLGWLVALGALLYLGASNGFSYGDDFTQGKTWKKILFRGLCGASYGLCGFLIGLGSENAGLGLTQLFLATAGSILFGVLNPFPSSWGNKATRAEDVCIAVSYVALLPFMI